MRASAPAKVLVVSPVLPHPLSTGSLVRINALVRTLERRFSVTLFCVLQGLETPEDLAAVRGICKRLVLHRPENKAGIVPRLLHRLRYECLHLINGIPHHVYYHNLASIQDHLGRVLSADTFDAVIQEYWYTSVSLHRMAPHSLRIVDTHDVHFDRMALFPPPGFFRFTAWDLKRYRDMELATLGTCDIILALTEGDRQRFSQFLNNEIRVVPTGVDMSRFPLTRRSTAVPGRIGFFGAGSNPANLDGLLHFYREVYPRIREQLATVCLYIIGGHVPPEVEGLARRDPTVHVTGFVPDLQRELEQLQVAVMPLRKTSGIRGRIYEIMASRVPMVAYPAAVQGMSLEAGRYYLEATTPGEFAREVVALLRHPEHGRAVVDNAYDYVKTRCSHEATYGVFCRELEERITARRETTVARGSPAARQDT